MSLQNITGYDKGTFMETTYVAGEDSSGKSILVDPGCFLPEIEHQIADTNGLAYIFITHGHADHIREINKYMDKYPDAKIVGCIHEKRRFVDPQVNRVHQLTGEKVSFEPDIYVSDGDTIKLGDTTFRFIETPGHTEGGMSILAGDVLFSGDTLFAGDIGRTDLDGGDFGQIYHSITEKLFKLPDETVVYPGHGQSTTIGYEKKHNVLATEF